MNPIPDLRLLLMAAVLAVAGCSSGSGSDTGANSGGSDLNGSAGVSAGGSAGGSVEGNANAEADNTGNDGGTGANADGAGTGGNGSDPDAGGDNALEPIASCTPIDLIDVGSGSRRIAIGLNAGERLALTNTPRGTLISVDETQGDIQYVPPAGRAPDTLTYDILDADGRIVARHEMTLRLDPMRIMPLGDSITQGVEIGTGDLDTPALPFRVGYRQALLEQLSAAGQLVDFTGQGGQRAGGDAGISDPDNNGYPGVDISFINDRVQEVFDELPSDVVLLHIGTNLTPSDAAGIDTILNNIDAWEAANFPVTVFVATLIPKRDNVLQQTVDQFNADLRIRLAARLSDNVVLVEQAAAVTVDDIDPSDVGVHPTAPGYLRMADTWFDAMTESGLFPDCKG